MRFIGKNATSGNDFFEVDSRGEPVTKMTTSLHCCLEFSHLRFKLRVIFKTELSEIILSSIITGKHMYVYRGIFISYPIRILVVLFPNTKFNPNPNEQVRYTHHPHKDMPKPTNYLTNASRSRKMTNML